MHEPFIGQIEPTALVRDFLACPPDGFAADAGRHGMPTFRTRFDLLTTAEPAFAARVQRWPLYRFWRRLLRPRTRFIGSTVSEYAWLPPAADPAALAGELVQDHGRECPFLIIKDLPGRSPLLDAHANAYAETFAAACRAAGFVLLAGQALAWVPIDFADENAYLARLSRGARRDIRRKLRSRDRLEIEALATGCDALCEPDFQDRLIALYEQVFAQSEVHFDHLRAAFFRRLFGDPDNGGIMFIYRHEGRIIGWNLCFEHGGALVDKYIGFDYPAARELNLYAVSWMHNLAYARRRGLERFVAGWTDPEVKAHLGARMTLTRHAVRPRSRLLRLALRRLAPHFENDRQWYEERAGEASGRT